MIRSETSVRLLALLPNPEAEVGAFKPPGTRMNLKDPDKSKMMAMAFSVYIGYPEAGLPWRFHWGETPIEGESPSTPTPKLP